MPKINSLKIVGCYAQTELGHGSNIGGLETTAKFDLKTDEFIINSPTTTSTKFWAGGLGLWANHAVVFARLIVEENDYGVQPFLIQIRSLETHECLPGIEIGEMGSKLGYNSKDNGFMRFNHIRIARGQHLSKLCGIDKEGNFDIRGDLRAIYQIMVAIRMQIAATAGFITQRVLQPVVRYAVCRRQFSTIDGSKVERKILDYQSHMYKLGPIVGNLIVGGLTGKYMQSLHRKMDKQIVNDDFKLLDLMHHLTSGFKSYFSEVIYNDMDTMRQSLGGVGISMHSLVPAIHNDYAPVAAFEGDNTVMAKQNARFLQKIIKKIVKGVPAEGHFSYLNHFIELTNSKLQA